MRLSPEAKQEEFRTFTTRMWAESPTQAPKPHREFLPNWCGGIIIRKSAEN